MSNVKAEIDPNKIYVAHRVGELVDYANPLTFSLIEGVFGYKGPFRNVLQKFFIGDDSIKTSYLNNVYGRVYSDLQLENQVLWEPSMFTARYEGAEVGIRPFFVGKYFPLNLFKFSKKALKELSIVSNPQKYINEIEELYKECSLATENVYLKKQISVNEFLNLYEHVVYVSYLFDLITKVNSGKKDKYALELKTYIKENDFLANFESSCIEKDFLVMKFGLGDKLQIIPTQKNLIPFTLTEFLSFVPKSIELEVKLQCIKNNLRLKTNILLYFLNRDLQRIAYQKGVSEYGMLTIEEISHLHSISAEQIAQKISERSAYLEIGAQKTLPDVILNGDISTKLAKVAPSKEDQIYKGTPCSAGIISGEVQFINDPKEEVEKPILMFPNASPTFTHQFRKAKGLVFKIGSPLSHGAIVAREMGIPAVSINLKEKLLIGKTITLEGSSGTLTVS